MSRVHGPDPLGYWLTSTSSSSIILSMATKVCRWCKETKDSTKFQAGFVCSKCRSKRQRQRQGFHGDREMYFRRLSRKHGLPIDTVRTWFRNPKCQNQECLDFSTRLVLDHDAITGQVRGVLCNNCNVALGMLGDNPDRIQGLLAYVTKQ